MICAGISRASRRTSGWLNHQANAGEISHSSKIGAAMASNAGLSHKSKSVARMASKGAIHIARKTLAKSVRLLDATAPDGLHSSRCRRVNPMRPKVRTIASKLKLAS